MVVRGLWAVSGMEAGRRSLGSATRRGPCEAGSCSGGGGRPSRWHVILAQRTGQWAGGVVAGRAVVRQPGHRMLDSGSWAGQVTVDRDFFLSFTGADRPWAEWL